MDDDIEAAIRQSDTDDIRVLYLSWCALRKLGRRVVPRVSEAFGLTKRAQARAAIVHGVTPFARFDDGAVEIGLRALSDRSGPVRARACGLLAQSGSTLAVAALEKLVRGPSRDPARRAIATLTTGEPFAAGDDPFYIFFRQDRGRAPRGHFADDLEREMRAWFAVQGLQPTSLFAHELAAESRDVAMSIRWDSYDVETWVMLTVAAERRPSLRIPSGRGDIAAIGEAIRRVPGIWK